MSPSDPSQNKIHLVLEPESEYTQVSILDGRLQPVDGGRGTGRHEIDLPPGLYQVVFSSGSQVDSHIVQLNPNDSEHNIKQKQSFEIASAAPIYKSRTSRESQGSLAQQDSLSEPVLLPTMGTGGAHLLLFLRELYKDRVDGNPAVGLTLHQVRTDGQERIIFDFGADGQFRPDAGTTSMHLNLDPDSYFLQVETMEGRKLRQMIYLVEGWQTQVFLVTRSDKERRRADFSTMSVLTVPAGVGFDPASPELTQATEALDALSRGESINRREVDRLLNSKFQNPMLGVYGFYLYLNSQNVRMELCTTIFENLLSMVGPLPDIIAAGWGALLKVQSSQQNDEAGRKIKTALYEAGAIKTPPMLVVGWRYLSQSSYAAPWLIPHGSLLEQISGQIISAQPWLFWESSERERSVRTQGSPGTLSGLESQSPSSYARYEEAQMDDVEKVELSVETDQAALASGGDILQEMDDILQRMSTLIQENILTLTTRLNPNTDNPSLSSADQNVLFIAFPYLRAEVQPVKSKRYSSRTIHPWEPLSSAELVDRLNYPALTVLSILDGLERWLA